MIPLRKRTVKGYRVSLRIDEMRRRAPGTHDKIFPRGGGLSAAANEQ
jgi:hypothetical protein